MRQLTVPRGLSLRGQTHRRRVLRGGAFNNNERNVRCAVRNRNNPNDRNRNIGFRVVVSTFFPARTARRSELLFRAEANNGGVCSWPRPRPTPLPLGEGLGVRGPGE
jgi:hypothetical protein